MKRPRLLQPGERPTHDEWNELVQEVYAITRLTVKPPLKLDTHSGYVLSMQGQQPVGMFKLSGTATKPGMYTANPIYAALSQPDHTSSSQLASADFGRVDTTVTVYLINTREEAVAGHALSAATVPNKFIGFFRGFDPGDGKPIYAINECQ